MRTEELIERLGRDADPVTPLPAPGLRTAMWTAWVAVYLGAVAVSVLTGRSVGGASIARLYLLQQMGAVVMGLGAARAALGLVIPGTSKRMYVWPVLGAFVWSGSLLMQGAVRPEGAARFAAAAQTDWPCVVSMMLGGVWLAVPLVWMLRRGAPLMPRLTALCAGLAAVSVANIEACLTRPHLFALTVLLWHGGTIVLFTVLSVWLGRRLLRWPSLATA